MLNLRRRGRRVAIGGAIAGAASIALAFAAPAGASTTTNTGNNEIIGSGSSTTYTMMQALDTLFNQSLGCYMTQPSGTTQTLNFTCASNNEGDQVGEGYTGNPVNDVALEQPELGSSAGIQQIEYGGTGSDGTSPANPTAVVNYARSSRQFKGSDYPGLNFVAYATDGLSWFTFPSVNGKTTASGGITNPNAMTVPDLTNIWNGTYTHWNQIPGLSDANTSAICVYTAQLSSGTEATWATALFGSTGTPAQLNAYVNSNPKVGSGHLNGCKVPTGQTYATSHTLPENESQDIVRNGDQGNAIYFFSYGKYEVECALKKPTSLCNDGKSTDIPNLGPIDGVTASPSTILCGTGCSEQFPVTRNLFNVYSNGSFNTTVNAEYGFPAATPATINYVSEIGFLCKPQVDNASPTPNQIISPESGNWVRTDIANTITAQGFIPFALQTTGEDAGGTPLDTPATAVLAADGDTPYSANDPIVGAGTTTNEANGNPEGYCLAWTTDGNPTP
jgi:hypothetical protein